MKRHQLLVVGSVLAVLLSMVIIYRSLSVRAHFENSVSESLKTTEGYDQRFIDMVNRLEDLLATRAKFGYSGGKDPMTGTTRQVVQQQQPAPVAVKTGRAQRASTANSAAAAPAAPQAADRVKLTAIIGDAAGRKFTAVIMDGERSFSVDPGDAVAGRKITRITNEGIYMESDSVMFFYDIYGNVVKKNRETGAAVSAPHEEPAPQEEPRKQEPTPPKAQHHAAKSKKVAQ